ncbi:hypothetical protein ABN214_15485 [Proteus terrae]|uniref:hypothetical protein n=1 Tax=Proteus terrae TaxID=1574161 RepID=UPI0032DB8AEA
MATSIKYFINTLLALPLLFVSCLAVADTDEPETPYLVTQTGSWLVQYELGSAIFIDLESWTEVNSLECVGGFWTFNATYKNGEETSSVKEPGLIISVDGVEYKTPRDNKSAKDLYEAIANASGDIKFYSTTLGYSRTSSANGVAVHFKNVPFESSNCYIKP